MEKVTVYPQEVIEQVKIWIVLNVESNVYQVALNLNLLIMFHGSEAIADIAAFIEWAELNKVEKGVVLATVKHDLEHAEDPDCLLRTSGYSSILAEEMLSA